MRALKKVPVLILNASYEPIGYRNAQEALKLWAKGAGSVLETYDRPFYRGMLLPSVIRLNFYRHIPVRKHTVNRRNILTRDRFTCQYCGKPYVPAHLTLDHILPRSRGGATVWENLATCCKPCNNRKGNLTPDEAGMALLTTPRAMNLHTARNLMRTMAADEPSWRKYLYF